MYIVPLHFAKKLFFSIIKKKIPQIINVEQKIDKELRFFGIHKPFGQKMLVFLIYGLKFPTNHGKNILHIH